MCWDMEMLVTGSTRLPRTRKGAAYKKHYLLR